MKLFQRIAVVFAAMILVSVPMFAQGTTATLNGTVTHEGAPLPGVTVTISSPALQGVRTSVTNENGGYSFPGIPPGEYTVRFDMEGMSTVTRTVRANVASSVRADANMRLSAVAEAITVTASAPAVLETQEIQHNTQAEQIEELPIGRTLQAATLLAPGVTTNRATGGIQISGAYSYDNLFMVNGAVTNENLRGQTHNLFIEDAIQEQTVMTGAISAEYGRFTGGVVSAITKSGGNEFHGSLRDSLTNPSWTNKTPWPTQADPLDVTNEVYEGTLGGRIVRDRLWFFLAGRYADVTADAFLARAPEFTFAPGEEETRIEAKLTGQVTPKHSLVGSYLDVKRDQTEYCFVSCLDYNVIDPVRSLPNDFMTFAYNGILTSNWLLELTYSQKNFTFENSGGDLRAIPTSGSPSQALINDIARATPGYDGVVTGGFFNAPVFCGVCSPEERNNDLMGIKSTYYLGTRSLGNHNIVAGYEKWAEQRVANNFQSGSDFFVNLYSYSPINGRVNGVVHPRITAGDSIGWWPILEFTKGSDWATDSIFINDKWDLNDNFSFNLGARYDANEGRDSSGNLISDNDAFSPRLGVTYDIFGNGRLRANASYSRYVSRIAETIGGSAGQGGNPAAFYWEYLGDDINANLSMNSNQAFAELFRRFFAAGQGGNNWTVNTAYGPINVPGDTSDEFGFFYIDIPGLTSQFRGTLDSPQVDEITIGIGGQINQNGYLRADYITREWGGMYSRRIDLTTGRVSEPFAGNTYDLGIIENTDDLERTYDGIQLQGNYRLGTRFHVGGNYTWSETKGNTQGETSGSGPVTDASFQYPEYRGYAQMNPVGLLDNLDQTHKLRVWAGYDLPTPVGNFNFSVLQRFDSGYAYSALGTIDLRARTTFYGPGLPGGITNPGYITPPSALNYYFSDRGEYRWDDEIATDLAINYALPIRALELFVQGEVINVFDQDAQIGGDTTIYTNRNRSTLTRFNPVAGDVPVEGVHWQKGPNFGQPVSQNSYQQPLTYRVSLGLRF